MINSMRRNNKQRVFAFIDSQNLNVSVQQFGWKMDWRKFRKFLKDKYGVDKAFMFIGYMPENQDMYERLNEAGFAIVLKPTLEMMRPPATELTEQPDKKAENFKTFGEQALPAGRQAAEDLADEKPAPSTSKSEQPEAVKKPVKGNVDAELVLWAMKEMPNYEKAVIVSGDGDFYSLVEYLLEKDKLLKLLTPTLHYSSLFKPFEKHIEQLGKHRRQLAYRRTTYRNRDTKINTDPKT